MSVSPVPHAVALPLLKLAGVSIIDVARHIDPSLPRTRSNGPHSARASSTTFQESQ
ncbi:hypothetical protein AURDEDRAFT_178428 [Auricularia subglabra TFB-10046 SS5]|uniref:Uncharacterized protein n=1 Tax=Auricularia subglabra (strain TFB-10046 / SS5) TaxID=717982 RepID=J0L864_AURST|nr:hypothetical protein AURDEDRAFT_178428 [Auricularia subglabra TFB-10046 SS5]